VQRNYCRQRERVYIYARTRTHSTTKKPPSLPFPCSSKKFCRKQRSSILSRYNRPSTCYHRFDPQPIIAAPINMLFLLVSSLLSIGLTKYKCLYITAAAAR
jgi:hypothetical protein